MEFSLTLTISRR